MLTSWLRDAQEILNYKTLGISRTIHHREVPQNALCNDIIMAHISFAFNNTQLVPPPLQLRKQSSQGIKVYFVPYAFAV